MQSQLKHICAFTTKNQLLRKYIERCCVYLSTDPPPSLASLEEIAHQTFEGNDNFVRKSCRVTILGALSTTGKALALLLKQNPLVSQLNVHDVKSTMDLVGDLRHLDTKPDIMGYFGDDVPFAVRNADIIVALGMERIRPNTTLLHKLHVEGKRVIELATASAINAPKAIFVDCVAPLSVTLPIVTEVYRRNHWYHPGKIVGSVAQHQMRINAVHARDHDLPVLKVHVPLLGGPDEDIILPLFSRALPQPLSLPEAVRMLDTFRNKDALVPRAGKGAQCGYAPYGNAYAINRLVSTIALGLLGDNNATSTAFVRTNFMKTCKHLVTTVCFGREGIFQNYGVPKLTNFELKLFEKITMELKKREEIARTFINENMDESQPASDAHVEAIYFPATVEFAPPDDTIVVDS